MANRLALAPLYVILDAALLPSDPVEFVKRLMGAGARLFQYRNKIAPAREVLQAVQALNVTARQDGAAFLVNDRRDIARLAGANGVHVGQDDLPARAARTLIGPDMLLGVSTQNLDQARRAFFDGADYIGVGPVFRSTTKPRDFLPGLAFARQVAQTLPNRPAVAIAGITAQNVDEVLATGVRAVAVSSAVLGAPDVRAAAAELKRKLFSATTPPRAHSEDTDVGSSARLVDQP